MQRSFVHSQLALASLALSFGACSKLAGPVASSSASLKEISLAASESKSGLILNVDGNFRVADIVKTFGPQNPDWLYELGFTVQISPMQDSDARIKSELNEAFRLAKKNNLRLLVHINHEWLFRGCAYCSDADYAYANAMVEKLVGVRVLPAGYQRIDSSDAILKNVEWTTWTTPQDVHMLHWGEPPTAMPPRINFASAAIREFLRQKSVVINSALSECFANYFPKNDRLFAGIDVGWETGIEDQDPKVKLGFGALKTRGYSASSNLSADQIDDILLQVAKEFADSTTSFYADTVDKTKIFTHYALYDKKFTSGLPYFRWRRNPAHLAKLQQAVPGFSIYLCSSKGCPSLYEDLKNDITGTQTNAGWAVTETTPELSGVLLKGFPDQGIAPPRFVVAYNFSAVELAGQDQINAIRSALGSGGGPYKGIFRAQGGVNYSNGTAYCYYKDMPTYSCMTKESSADRFPDRPDLLTSLTAGGECSVPPECKASTTPAPAAPPVSSPSGTSYKGIFRAKGGVNYSNGSEFCYYKDMATFTCMTKESSADRYPEMPELLTSLKGGGECAPPAECQVSSAPATPSAPTPAPTPSPQTPSYKGIFRARGGVNYSNGSAYCYYKDMPTYTCMTKERSADQYPDLPDLLTSLQGGGECTPPPSCR